MVYELYLNKNVQLNKQKILNKNVKCFIKKFNVNLMFLISSSLLSILKFITVLLHKKDVMKFYTMPYLNLLVRLIKVYKHYHFSVNANT